jgi:cytochrome c556
MKRSIIVFASCLLLMPSSALTASEKPAESYQAAMKELGVANAALRKHVQEIEAAGAYPDYNPIEKDVEALKGPFTTALSFWTARHADDAVAQVTTALMRVEELEKARKEKNYDALMTAAAEIGKTCGGCHNAHREKMPDGSYEVK